MNCYWQSETISIVLLFFVLAVLLRFGYFDFTLPVLVLVLLLLPASISFAWALLTFHRSACSDSCAALCLVDLLCFFTLLSKCSAVFHSELSGCARSPRFCILGGRSCSTTWPGFAPDLFLHLDPMPQNDLNWIVAPWLKREYFFSYRFSFFMAESWFQQGRRC